MGLGLGALLQVLYRPKQAFDRLMPETKLIYGLLIAFVLAAAAQVIPELPAALGLKTEIIIMPKFFEVDLSARVIDGIVAAARSVAGIILGGIMVSVLAGYLGGERRVSKTVTLLCYAQILTVASATIFTVIDIIVNATQRELFAIMALGGEQAMPFVAQAAGAAGYSFGAIALLLSITFIAWNVWISGHAVATANKTTFKRGAAAFAIVLGLFFIVKLLLRIQVLG